MDGLRYRHERRPARCNCPDCTTDFATHNGGRKVCTCQQCVEFRENNMPAPATNYAPFQYNATAEYNRDSQLLSESIRRAEARQNDQRIKAERQKMSSLNMCEREGCNALIRGNAVGLADILTNNGNNGLRRGWELCPACTAEVDTLLHTAPTGKRERAYDTPYEGYKTTQETDQPEDIERATVEQLVAALMEKVMKEVSNGQRAISSIPTTIRDPHAYYEDDDD